MAVHVGNGVSESQARSAGAQWEKQGGCCRYQPKLNRTQCKGEEGERGGGVLG